MRRIVLLSFMAISVLLSLCLVAAVEADSSMWSRTYGGTTDDDCCSLVATSDGGYAIAGYTDSFGAGEDDFWLVKADASGNMEWNRTYGGTDYDEAYSLVETSDGGYALAGWTASFGAGTYDFWLVKTDAFGNMEWNRTYGGEVREYAASLVATSDGGYAIAGYIFGTGGDGFWLVKADASGNMEWNRTYGGAEAYGAYSLVAMSDGGYAIAGRTPDACLLIKTDAAGNMEWNQKYGGCAAYNDMPFFWHPRCSLVAMSDGGYALAVSTYGSNSVDFGLIRTDEYGNIEWNKTYGGPDFDWATSLVATSDGGYAIAGNTESSGAGEHDYLLVKTDAFGNMEWKKTYGGKYLDFAYSLVATSDGAYTIAGRTWSFGAGGTDAWLVKTGGCVNTYEYEMYEFDYDFGYFTYTVVVWTNSTLGNFDYGLYENQISFNVTGPDGTSGFCKIAIPEELVGDDFPIYLNETLLIEGIDYTRTYNGTHTIIDITYSHSTHMIEITGTNVVPEYSSWLLPTLLLTATFVVIIYKKKLLKPHS